MYKIMFMVRRKPGLTREEFREHYEGWHAPWGIRHFNGGMVTKYVRNHIKDADLAPLHSWLEEGTGPSLPFDAIVEFWFDSEEGFRKWQAWKAEQPDFHLLQADEFSFFDVETAVCCFVDEIEELRDEPATRPPTAPPLEVASTSD